MTFGDNIFWLQTLSNVPFKSLLLLLLLLHLLWLYSCLLSFHIFFLLRQILQYPILPLLKKNPQWELADKLSDTSCSFDSYYKISAYLGLAWFLCSLALRNVQIRDTSLKYQEFYSKAVNVRNSGSSKKGFDTTDWLVHINVCLLQFTSTE